MQVGFLNSCLLALIWWWMGSFEGHWWAWPFSGTRWLIELNNSSDSSLLVRVVSSYGFFVLVSIPSWEAGCIKKALIDLVWVYVSFLCLIRAILRLWCFLRLTFSLRLNCSGISLTGSKPLGGVLDSYGVASLLIFLAWLITILMWAVDSSELFIVSLIFYMFIVRCGKLPSGVACFFGLVSTMRPALSRSIAWLSNGER